jgi:hypothetical protein
LKIPPFGVLYKKIKIPQYCLHLTWKREQEEEMRFQKHQVYNKKSPKFLPVIPLLPTKLLSDELKDKAAHITFTLQVSEGLAPGTPTYRKSIRTFEEGDPQQWMEVITGLKEIWAQNSIPEPRDMWNTTVVILKGDGLTSYEAAMEDNRTNLEDKSLMVPMTEQHINDALLAVPNQIFPYCALKTQKQWMSKYARKPYEMGACKQFVISMSQINKYIPFFPNATVLSKYSKEELLNILEFAVPPHWRKAFDLRDYLPTSDNKARFMRSVIASNGTKRPRKKRVTTVTMTARATKKLNLQNLRKVPQKVVRKKKDSGPKYCTHCKTDTHNTEHCWKLKKKAKEKELSEKKAPYSKRSFRKEVNAIARRAGVGRTK